MEKKEEILRMARIQHQMLEKRLRVLLEKPYLTDEEEIEIKNLKKKKLYYKDLMERIKGEIEKEET